MKTSLCLQIPKLLVTDCFGLGVYFCFFTLGEIFVLKYWVSFKPYLF